MEVSTQNKLVNCWNWGSRVCAIFETPDKSRKIEEFSIDWYFVIRREDKIKAKKVLEDNKILGFRLVDDPIFPKWTKIYVDTIINKNTVYQDKYQVVLKLERAGIKTFEGDLMPDRRWYVDNTIEIAENFSKLYFDIETDDRIQVLEVGRDRILSFAAIDSQGKEFFYILKTDDDENEESLLKKILKLFSMYDIILGWNSRDFDLSYIKIRAKRYQSLSQDLHCLNKIAKYDLLRRFRHIFRFDSYIKRFSLEFISQHFLSKGKVIRTQTIYELWSNEQKKLKEYNLEDARLTKELDDKLNVSDMMIRQSQWCKVPPSKFGLYSIIDAHILRIAHDHREFAPTSIRAISERNYDNRSGNENPNDTETKKKKYLGALVLEPKPGKYNNVYTFDFKSLYPSLIRTSNIGYETLRYDPGVNRIINPGTQHIPRMSGQIKPTYFEKSPSIIAIAVTNLLEKRTEYKNLKLKMIEEGKNRGREWDRVVSDEIIVKELSNSTYGIMGLEYGRYYSTDIAESITLFGQWAILSAKRFFESCGYTVLYGDTDSIFIAAEILDVQDVLSKYHTFLKDELKNIYNINDCYIQLNFDKYYKYFLLVTKKTYVGRVLNIEGKKTDEYYTRGLDYLKRNSFSFAKEKQKELVLLLLEKNASKEELLLWYGQVKEDFYSRTFTKEELTITQKVNKSFNKYKTLQLHSKLALEYKQRTGEYLKGGEIDYIVTQLDTKMEGCLLMDWDGKTFDKDYYWYHKTVPLLERLIRVVYPDIDFNDSPLSPAQKRKLKYQLSLFPGYETITS